VQGRDIFLEFFNHDSFFVSKIFINRTFATFYSYVTGLQISILEKQVKPANPSLLLHDTRQQHQSPADQRSIQCSFSFIQVSNQTQTMSDSPPKKGFETLKERFIEKLDIFDMDISSDEEGVKKHIKKTVSCASQFQEFSSFGGVSGLYPRSQGKRNTGNLVIVNKSNPADQASVIKSELVHS
jgi:hypothetical protein